MTKEGRKRAPTGRCYPSDCPVHELSFARVSLVVVKWPIVFGRVANLFTRSTGKNAASLAGKLAYMQINTVTLSGPAMLA